VKILLTGKNGQVGWELERCLLPRGRVFAFDRASLDLTDPDQIVARVRELKPELIVNAAAYTAVDRAESEPEIAMQINTAAPGILAEEAKRLGALLVHYSTDYVFDGMKPTPYLETDTPNPISAYGRSKLEGERAIQASGCRHLILRTSWVYGLRGKNFLLTILRLAREGRELRVVDDQIGAPTWCRDIAVATARLAQESAARETAGLFHLTAAGATSWYGFAREILETSGLGAPVMAIPSSEYRSPARRPANSLLSCAKLKAWCNIELPEWPDSLRSCLAEAGTSNDPMSAAGLPGIRTAVGRVSVSVVIPCYRCVGTIRRAVVSVAKQSVLPAELILVDDASGDGTLKVLRELQRDLGEDWVKVLALRENVGAGSARNSGWNAASCKYIAFLDADDAWHPRKIEIQHAFMEAHPDVALGGHSHRRIAEGESVDAALMQQGFRMVSRWELLLSNRFVTPSTMVRRDVTQRFQAGRRYMEDHLLWLEIASDGLKVVRLNDVLAFTYKAPVGDAGLSARTWEMRKAELSNFWYLYRTERLGFVATVALCGYSLAKHARRVLFLARR